MHFGDSLPFHAARPTKFPSERFHSFKTSYNLLFFILSGVLWHCYFKILYKANSTPKKTPHSEFGEKNAFSTKTAILYNLLHKMFELAIFLIIEVTDFL